MAGNRWKELAQLEMAKMYNLFLMALKGYFFVIEEDKEKNDYSSA